MNFSDLDITTGTPDSLFRKGRIFLAGLKHAAFGPPDNAAVFIIGTGRSGTHWLGWILERSKELSVSIENPHVFRLVTEMAIYPDSAARLFPKLVKRYQAEKVMAAPRHFVDKSHPNLWLAEDLARALPNAKFIGMTRDPFGTIASMEKHTGVMYWIDNWKKFPVPNRFLGITEENVQVYEGLSVAAKCALRWRVHTDELRRLQGLLKDNLLVLDYQHVQNNTAEILVKLQKFLNLSHELPMPDIKRESLEKWKSQLSAEDIADIEAVINHQAI